MVSVARRSTSSSGGAAASMTAIPRSSRRVRCIGVLSASELRSDVAFPLADPERDRVRAVRLRQETGALAAHARGHRLFDLSVLHIEHPVAGRSGRRARRRPLGGGSRRMVIMPKLRLLAIACAALATIT